MCLGVPMQIAASEGIAGQTTTGALIDLTLTGPLAPGTWVLTFLGAAREVIDETRAQQISDALAGLSRLMDGDDLGDAFADLNDGPSLPPHLAAAMAAGKTTA